MQILKQSESSHRIPLGSLSNDIPPTAWSRNSTPLRHRLRDVANIPGRTRQHRRRGRRGLCGEAAPAAAPRTRAPPHLSRDRRSLSRRVSHSDTWRQPSGVAVSPLGHMPLLFKEVPIHRCPAPAGHPATLTSSQCTPVSSFELCRNCTQVFKPLLTAQPPRFESRPQPVTSHRGCQALLPGQRAQCPGD